MEPFGRWRVDWSHGYRWRGMGGRTEAEADAALGPDLGAVQPAEEAACIACAGIGAGHRRVPLREAARLGRIRKRSSERPVTW